MLKIQTEAPVDIFVRCNCGAFLACTSTLTNGENGENARIDVDVQPCDKCRGAADDTVRRRDTCTECGAEIVTTADGRVQGEHRRSCSEYTSKED